MYKKFFIIFLVFFFLHPNVVLSNNSKIAYLDVDFIIKNSNIGKNILKKFLTLIKKYRNS